MATGQNRFISSTSRDSKFCKGGQISKLSFNDAEFSHSFAAASYTILTFVLSADFWVFQPLYFNE